MYILTSPLGEGERENIFERAKGKILSYFIRCFENQLGEINKYLKRNIET